MAQETVLIVEDDPTMLRVLRDNFAFEGYHVETASDGEQGLKAALAGKPDLIVLDLMLPKVNGYEICRAVRSKSLTMPIIMLTAKSQESDVVLGLNLGADDYVTKPFGINELLARANALLRRLRRTEAEACCFGDFLLDLESHRLLHDEVEIELTPKEFGLLAYMVSRAGRALTREQILNAVWGSDLFVTSRSVDRCVNSLRAKIEPNPRKPVYIRTVREIGYRFECPDT